MSSSKKKTEANRKNAKHSTGPKSEIGKQHSSRNALKHGAFANDLIIKSDYIKENPADYEKLLHSITDELKPETLLQESLVRKIANCVWRARRIVAAETAHILQEHTFIPFELADYNSLANMKANHRDLEYTVPSDEEEEALAHIFAAQKSVPGYETARHLLYYEMRLDRQLTRAFKLFKELKRASQLEKSKSDHDQIPALTLPAVMKSDSPFTPPATTPESPEIKREPSIELPETNPLTSCPPTS